MEKIVPSPPYVDAKFNIKQVAELFGVSRTSLYQLEKERVIALEPSRAGATARKFTWDDLSKLSSHLAGKLKKPQRKKIKVFANLKGGVGKSSLCSQVAMLAASSGVKTLLIDLDPQAHASLALGFDNLDDDVSTIFNCLAGRGEDRVPLDKVIQAVTPLLSIIPSSLSLSSIEVKLQQDYKSVEKLKKLLTGVRDQWDLIVIDTNPSASLLNINALLAADEICVVSATDFLSVAGLRQLFAIFDDLKEDFEDFRPQIKIIPNLFDVREAIAQEALGVLRQKYGDFLTTTVVRKNVDLKEAQKAGQSVWLYKRRSPAAVDIFELTKELIAE